jgi:hypothetical protein
MINRCGEGNSRVHMVRLKCLQVQKAQEICQSADGNGILEIGT